MAAIFLFAQVSAANTTKEIIQANLTLEGHKPCEKVLLGMLWALWICGIVAAIVQLFCMKKAPVYMKINTTIQTDFRDIPEDMQQHIHEMKPMQPKKGKNQNNLYQIDKKSS